MSSFAAHSHPKSPGILPGNFHLRLIRIMDKITYRKLDAKTHLVMLDGLHTGRIKHRKAGWVYYPKGDRTGGDPFKSLAECKASLEYDDTEEYY